MKPNTQSPAFITGLPATGLGLLDRYLPPVQPGVARAWLETRFSPGGWVLDPFGASPELPVEAARAGFRVLVAANNPIARFLLELAARPPAPEHVRAALAELAATYKGDERMEPHIRSLYASECEQCGGPVMVEAFLWERGGDAPYACLYHCANCGAAGEHPCSKQDRARAARFPRVGLHQARALARVAPLDDPDREHAEEALAVYPPRAVYVLFTLLNKLDRLDLKGELRRSLQALLLAAFDRANTLWPYPTARARPRQLTIPPHYRENNIWLALETAIERWSAGWSDHDRQALPVSVWPELPPENGGICLFEGRLKDFSTAQETIQPQAVLAALPRPNQAFWTLSALWAGWLWGPAAAAPFKHVLRRRRYDWGWHTAALEANLRSLGPLLGAGVPFLGLIGEAEPGFVTAALLAARMAGFELGGIALRAGSEQAQMHWSSPAAPGEAGQPPETSDAPDDSARWKTGRALEAVGRQAAAAYLQQRAEPAGYLTLHTAACAAAVSSPEIAPLLAAGHSPPDAYAQLNAAVQRAFSQGKTFTRFDGSERSLETGLWWLNDPEGDEMESPLSDRVEMEVVRGLIRQAGWTGLELDQAVCAAFPGLLTPEADLLWACLHSYAEAQDSPTAPETATWALRPADQPAARQADLHTLRRLLTELGVRFGLVPIEKGPQVFEWRRPDGPLDSLFQLSASAVWGALLLGQGEAAETHTTSAAQPVRVIVYPGSRADLAAYKLRSDPRLGQALAAGWTLLKFRHVHRLAEQPEIDQQTWQEQLHLDPLSYQDPQIPLF